MGHELDAGYALTVCQPRIDLVFDERNAFLPDRLRRNVEHIGELITAGAACWGSKLFVLPQAALQGCVMRSTEEWIRAAVRLPGPETQALGRIAKQTGAYIAGCAYEIIDAFPGRYWNSAFLISPDAELVLVYRKHYAMTSKTRPGDVYDQFVAHFGEDALFPVAETPIGRIGAAIAGDVFWPEVTRCLAMKGAEIIFNPTSSGGRFDHLGRPGAEATRSVRAFENLTYLAMSNMGFCAGDSGDVEGQRPPSQVYDFTGAVICTALPGSDRMATAWIDISALRRLRATPMANFLVEMQPALHAREYARADFWPLNAWQTDRVVHQDQVFEMERKLWSRLVASGRFAG